MRIAAWVAVTLLVAGCSHTGGGGSRPSPNTTAVSGASPTTNVAPSGGPPAAAPDAGARISDVIAWIEAGHPADPARYHSATRDGATTQLGNDIALTATAGSVSCMTDTAHTGGALACLVKLTSPPPRPETAYGEWKGGWVDFDGTSVEVGSVRGDPGRFTAGTGPELPYGRALGFGDYQCRVDTVGLYCADRAHDTAVRFSDAGIEPFGCLQPATAPPQIGERFSC